MLYDIPGLAARSSLAPEPSSADVAAMEVPLSTPMPPDIVRLADSVEVARMLKTHGCDLVDVSTAGNTPDSSAPATIRGK